MSDSGVEGGGEDGSLEALGAPALKEGKYNHFNLKCH